MITSSKLREIGYSSTEATMIMQKLQKLGCNTKTAQIRSNYIRKGSTCDYLHYGNVIYRSEAVNALKAYCETPHFNTDVKFWKKVLKSIQADKIEMGVL